jgi:ArsR family transcriptional regulator, lead/cadmium/zinc/bismuth-responsive transcriptional repressor
MSNRHTSRDANGAIDLNVLSDVVEIFKSLSDPTRAQLVFLLTEQEYSVNDLAAIVEVSASAVSHHLSKLRAARLVRTRRSGNHIYYSVDDAHVAALFREALYHLDHVRRNLPDHPYTNAPTQPVKPQVEVAR